VDLSSGISIDVVEVYQDEAWCGEREGVPLLVYER